MLRAGNYSVEVDPLKGMKEKDSFTCGHCLKVIFVNPGQKGEDVGGLCKVCMSLICPECTNTFLCDPFEKKMERDEARDRFLRSAGF